MNCFKDQVATGILDTSSKLHPECLCFCFVQVMKKALCEIKNSWNSHDVSKSRHHAPSGIPNQLFFLSKSVLGENHGKLYQHTDIAEIERHITTLEDETHQLYREYF